MKEQPPEQLTLSRLYAIVKAIDDEQRRKIRAEQKEKEIAMPIFGILLGVLTAVVMLTVALKALHADPDLWRASGLAAAAFLLAIAVGWAVWQCYDLVRPLIRGRAIQLMEIDAAHGRDKEAAMALYQQLHLPAAPLPASKTEAIAVMVQHLHWETKERTMRYNLGALLAALGGIVMTTYDALQQITASLNLPDLPVYAGALSVGILVGSAMQLAFTRRLARIAELLERVQMLAEGHSSPR